MKNIHDIKKREEELQKQMDWIRRWYKKKMGIPDLKNPDDVRKKLLEIGKKVEHEKNMGKKCLEEMIRKNPEIITDGYIKFKNSLSFYGKFLLSLRIKESDFFEINNIKNLNRLKKSFKKLSEEVEKLALVYSYQEIKKAEEMEQADSKDFDHYYGKRHISPGDSDSAQKESIIKEFLVDGGGHQVTTSNEVEEQKDNISCLIISFIDKYIAGDDEKQFVEAYKAVKERRTLDPLMFESVPSIKKVIKQIEKQNELATELGRKEYLIPEEEIPRYIYLHFARGSFIPKKINYYRKKHFYTILYFNEHFNEKSFWISEGINLILLRLILNKWQEHRPNDSELTINNYYRVMFINAVLYNEDGYKLLEDLKKDLFGKWIKIKSKNIKQSKIWIFLQDYLYRKNMGKTREEPKNKILQEELEELRRQIIHKFGGRSWIVYIFRKIKNYSLRDTIKEIHKRKGKISKKTIDPLVQDIENWLKFK